MEPHPTSPLTQHKNRIPFAGPPLRPTGALGGAWAARRFRGKRQVVVVAVNDEVTSRGAPWLAYRLAGPISWTWRGPDQEQRGEAERAADWNRKNWEKNRKKELQSARTVGES